MSPGSPSDVVPRVNVSVAAFAQPDPSLAGLLGGSGFPASVDPDRVALRWDGGSLTYTEFKERVLRVAQALRARGLAPQDRISVLLMNRPEVLELLFACAYLGLTFVPINFRFREDEVRSVLEDCAPRLLVTQQSFASAARAAGAGLPIDVLELEDEPAEAGLEAMGLRASDPLVGSYQTADPLLMLYTSGTSGKPKGVLMSHGTVLWHAMLQICYYRDFTRETVLLANAPLYNASGIFDFVAPTFMVGGEVCLMPSGGWSAERFAKRVDEWAITHVLVFPMMLQALLEADQRSPIGLGSLRYVHVGGDHLPAATLERFSSRWRHFVLGTAYGLTEGGLLTYFEAAELLRHPQSVGRAVAPLRIVDDEGNDVPDGEVGEILAGGGAIFSGYFGAPTLTSAIKRSDGWLSTGDLGRRDEEGYYYIEGRKKDLIISGAQNIYPAEIEHVLSRHPAILEVAVVGVPDERWGEAVCAVVVPRDGQKLTAAEVREYAGTRLASYKKPKYVQFVDSLPRSALTYVLKEELRAQFLNLGDTGTDG